jgi:hypothetical protein
LLVPYPLKAHAPLNGALKSKTPHAIAASKERRLIEEIAMDMTISSCSA